MSEEQVEEAPELESFVPQVDTPDDEDISLLDSDNLDKGNWGAFRCDDSSL